MYGWVLKTQGGVLGALRDMFRDGVLFIDITSMKLSINTTFPKTLYAAYATYLPHTTPIRFISAPDLPQKPTAMNPLGASSV
jgi:hypothetical protein